MEHQSIASNGYPPGAGVQQMPVAVPTARRPEARVGLPITNRQQAAVPTAVGIGVGLPIASRQTPTCAGGSAITAALPIASRQQPASHGAYLPIASCQHSAVPTGANGPDGNSVGCGSGSFSFEGLPKWARPTSVSSDHIATSFDSTHSMSSSCTSKTLESIRRFESNASFSWAPGQVLVKSWQQKLCTRYNDYNMVNIVGEGRAGAVFIVQHRHSETYYACKLLHKAEHNDKALRSEIDMLRRLDHPNVVRLLDVVDDRESMFLLMELCQGGDLFGRIEEEGHLSENVARIFAEQMLSALAYCHRMRIVHRDVKPENFLLENEDPECVNLKLADFGIATRIRAFGQPPGAGSFTAKSGHVPEVGDGGEGHGTLPYMAPEMFHHSWNSLKQEAIESVANQVGRHSDGANDLTLRLAAGDMWSVGVVIYVMLSGDLPFGWSTDAICAGKPPDFSKDVWANVSDEAKDIILRLMNPKAEDRWTARRALGHAWFKGMSSDTTSPATAIGGKLEDGSWDSQMTAITLLQMLRKWRKLHKLRRICIAAIAKRLEGDHPAQQMAKTAFRLFSSSTAPEVLSCEQLVHAMSGALAGTLSDNLQPPALPSDETSESLQADVNSLGVIPAPTLTGFHVRQRVRNAVGCFSKISEETTIENSSTPSAMTEDIAKDTASTSELQFLVGSLDASKNGFVDFTLLVAALLPEDVYSNDQRTSEVFYLFDSQKNGVISPEDLRRAFNCRGAALKPFIAMVAEFDANRDGMLDLEEFRSMLRGQ